MTAVYEMIYDTSETRQRDAIPYSYERWQGVFYVHLPTDSLVHTTVFVKPVVNHWYIALALWNRSNHCPASSQRSRFDARTMGRAGRHLPDGFHHRDGPEQARKARRPVGGHTRRQARSAPYPGDRVDVDRVAAVRSRGPRGRGLGC